MKRSAFIHRLRYLVLALGLLPFWMAVQRKGRPNPAPRPVPGETSPPANVIHLPSDAAPATPAAKSTESSSNRFAQLLVGREFLARTASPTPSGSVRSTLYRTSFKFPLIRVVEDFREGSDTAIRSVAMVADHLLLFVTPDERPRLDRFLRRYPEVRLRSELSTGEHLLLEIPNPSEPRALELWQQRLQSEGVQGAGPDFIQQATVTTPNDPDYGQLWGLHNSGQDGGRPDADIDAQEAWDVSTGGGVVVAVVDSGVDYRHPDLAANLWTNSAGKCGYDFYDNDEDPNDPSESNSQNHGHGTHVGGTIAAAVNNGIGGTGVAWGARIMSLRFINAGNGGATSDAISCIRYATDNGARIINCSWSGSGGSPGDALNREITRARNQGVLFVAAAGNDGSDNDQSPVYPASYPNDNIVSVAATDRHDVVAHYSNFGPMRVHLAAPGSEIFSTLPNGRYGTMSGTSMAAPHVSGTAALILAASPSLTYAQVRSRLLAGCEPLPSLAGKVATGGRLNAHRSIRDLAGPFLTLPRRIPVIIRGNGDSHMNPGEVIRLDLGVANQGGQAAPGSSVTASLPVGAPATLNRSVLNVGNLAANSSSTQDNAFTLTLGHPATLPSTFAVTFTLATLASTSTWTETLTLTLVQASRIAGLVTRAGTGAPIAGARVTIRGAANFDLSTDAAGRYLADTVAGNYQVTAAATGLLESETREIQAGANTPPIDFALGNAALRFSPQTRRVSIPPNQTQTLQVELRHTGDTPRSLPVQIRIRGTGSGDDELYGLSQPRIGGPMTLLQLDPSDGRQLSSRVLSLIPNGLIRGFCATADSLWILVDDSSEMGTRSLIYPVSPESGAIGTPRTLSAPPSREFLGLSATPDKLLITAFDFNAFTSTLNQYDLAKGTLSLIGSTPGFASGPVAASPTRQSVFLLFDEARCHELRFPTLTQLRQWDIPSLGGTKSAAFSDALNTLFLTGYSFTNAFGPPSLAFLKLHPDTGSPISGFSPPASIDFVATRPTTSARWLTTGMGSTEVPSGSFRTVPLTISTAGMALGQSFDATVTVESPLLDAPVRLQVHLDISDSPDSSTWSGWFEAFYRRSPTIGDLSADEDHDGIPNYLEFATGGDPTTATAYPGQPRYRLTEDHHFEFTYLMRKSLTNGEVIPEFSADLSNWTEAPANRISSSSADAVFNRITVSLPATADSQIIRLSARP